MPAPQRQTSADELRSIRAKVREIYKKVDQLPIERYCETRTECCRFRLTGKTPLLTFPEAYLAAQSWKGTGRKEIPEPADGSCPFLNATGKCLIYNDRPFGCRTHYCQPAGGPIARKVLIEYIRELESLPSPEDFKNGPIPIERAIPAALKVERM